MANSTAPETSRAIRRDRTAQATLGLAIVLNILLFVLVFLTYDQLTESMAGSVGGSQRFSSPSSAFILPIIGLVSWLSAGILGFFFYSTRDQATIAYTIWGVAVLIQLATWVPIVNLVTGI
jgi:hypothetical protein